SQYGRGHADLHTAVRGDTGACSSSVRTVCFEVAAELGGSGSLGRRTRECRQTFVLPHEREYLQEYHRRSYDTFLLVTRVGERAQVCG
ncbi:hypothetical protein, partial [Silvimonas sp.]|uniref:hypothetical protein n=1 Tax=Silvimonas sp. TaxID=2650811 RepID=UPI00283EDFB6